MIARRAVRCWVERRFSIEKQRQFMPAFVSRVEDGRALPASFLVFGQFTELGDHALPRTPLGSPRLDECEVAVPLAILAALVLAKKHPCLHLKSDTDSALGKQVGPHYNEIRATDYASR
jgi:hypothetical protein